MNGHDFANLMRNYLKYYSFPSEKGYAVVVDDLLDFIEDCETEGEGE